MSAVLLALLVMFGLVIVAVMIVVGMYNGLVTLRNRYKNAFSQIDVQLKRRYDLIPNLVEVAKGYIKHERETLEAVVTARNAAYSAGQQAARNPGDAGAMTALGGAEGLLTGALGRLFAVAEAYPDLKANQNMLALQEELSATENKIAFARQAYNDSVMVYNTKREVFPTSIIAGMFNFQEAHLFEVEQPAEREAPKVSFTETMATDFFARQDHARRQTVRLMVLFALSVAAIIIAIYFVVAIGVDSAESTAAYRVPHGQVERGVERRVERPATPVHRGLWRPELFLGIAAGTLLVVALGSLYKIAQLSAGGEAVALMMGARAVDPQTTNLAERRLLNIVEEMALASGIPVPPVYVMDNEPSINAFAAGHQPGDAVVAVSAGSLQYLSRDELQGVMAHEFSHILNGDMRLNLRLIGVVNGILVLAILGYYLLRFGGMSSNRSSKDNSGAAVFFLGVALMILGYLGVFFGNLIKAAISRQREFLADASAVQFTRYPGGIAGALKKIGGLDEGSHIRDAHASEISHMFFGNAFAGSFFQLFATHPPLDQRIRALEPDFDGRFPAVEPVRVTAEPAHARTARTAATIPIPAIPIPAILAGGAMPLDAGMVTRQVGAPQPEHLDGATAMIANLPPLLLTAAREPFSAQAVIFALLLSHDDAVRSKQLQQLQSLVEQPLYGETNRLAAAAQALPPTTRLPLVDLAMPAIKRSSPQQYAAFRQAVNTLIGADSQVDLFEYCLRTMLFSYLDVHFGLKKPPTVHYRTVDAVAGPLTVVLSALAYVGHDRPEEIEKAFQAGAKSLPGQVALLPLSECSLDKFDAALAELVLSSPNLKREIIGAVTACIAFDGQVTLQESALLRAIAAALACPLPPITAGV